VRSISFPLSFYNTFHSEEVWRLTSFYDENDDDDSATTYSGGFHCRHNDTEYGMVLDHDQDNHARQKINIG
jgi:hypothetical protein